MPPVLLYCSLMQSLSLYMPKFFFFLEGDMSDFYFVGASECFPSETKIRLERGKIVKMSELQKGDKVQTGK